MMNLDAILNPERPAGAYYDLLEEVLPVARQQRVWTPADGPMPALFVSHGAPPTLDDADWLRSLFNWGQSLPKPRGIVIVSAHWENAPLAVTNIAKDADLFYDFGGFHPHYYTMQYRTPDATELAQRLVRSFADTTTVYEHPTRGLDHGAFIPLMAMFPTADIPVIQISMPSLDPEALLNMGARLKNLRAEGYLVMGSGFMTHSFKVMRDPSLIGANREFDAWAADAITRRDIDALLDYQNKGPQVRVAHPTADHYVPLLMTLGAADNESTTPEMVITREAMGNSIRSFQAA